LTLQRKSSQQPESRPFIGAPVQRVEDAALLTGRALFMDDLGTRPGTLHAAFVRSPHAHAHLKGVDARHALSIPGVRAVVTGADIQRLTKPFTVGVKASMQHWSLAIDRVRYQGEPVAIVLGETPYVAEDGAAAVDVAYERLDAVVDPILAMASTAIRLHPDLASNVVSERRFRYGDPEAQFATADYVVGIDISYPRNSVTPIECFGVVAEYRPGDGSYEVLSNFQGPFALHPVMAMALQVPSNRLRLKSAPNSGGSFGTKQAVFGYAVALAVAARVADRPVKWIEDRLEHLMAATSATNRVTTLKAAVRADGRITALDWDQIDDCGAYLRVPEPATLYRMHGNMNGAYDIRHLAIRNQNVLTNKTPSGLVRGFGGPQVYFALERLVQRIAITLDRDPLEIIRINLIDAGAFPYRTASGGLYDSGNYQAALHLAEVEGHIPDLRARKSTAQRAGRLYGIGYAAVVEPAISNMGYITAVLTAEERERAGPKGGAVATATVGVDALGGVSVHVSSVPQGQGHQTALAQVVADTLGLEIGDFSVNTDLDTGKDAWSVASGNYSSRFSGAVAGAASLAAEKLKRRLAETAFVQLAVKADDLEFRGGKVFSRADPTRSMPFRRLAATSHWAQSTLPQGAEPVIRETAFWSPDVLTPPNAHDEINSSAVHGFVFDACGVEIDRATGQVRIDKYVSVHDAGRLINPAMADGQVRGAFANGLGAALYEHFSYGHDGSFQSGTFADYTVPTAAETPDIEILHIETRSPVTPLGSKGLGEGNCMSTPVAIANAVADALGVADVELPLTPSRVAKLLQHDEPLPQGKSGVPRADAGIGLPALARTSYDVNGQGDTLVALAPDRTWQLLHDPVALAAVVPGCKSLDVIATNHFRGQIELGVGIVKGLFQADVTITDVEPGHLLRLHGTASGPLGASRGEGFVRFVPEGETTRLHYAFGVDLSGKVAAIGGRMIEGAARALVGEFFRRLARSADPQPVADRKAGGLKGWLSRLIAWFTGGPR
jgi:2-furoyl-CoA dehydrogenase large subunit